MIASSPDAIWAHERSHRYAVPVHPSSLVGFNKWPIGMFKEGRERRRVEGPSRLRLLKAGGFAITTQLAGE